MKKVLVLIYTVMFHLASEAYALDCDAIMRHGLRNIQISKSSGASVATKFFNHCNKNFSDMEENDLTAVEIKVLGYGDGAGSSNKTKRVEKLDDWCKTNKETATENKAGYEESQEMYGGAVSAWDNCNVLNSKQVEIKPIISPDAKDVEFTLKYTGPTLSGIGFYGVKTKGFSCETLVPTDTGLSEFNIQTPTAITNQAISISCTRDKETDKTIDGQTYSVLPRGIITVKTASHPLQLFFPEEYTPSLPQRNAGILSSRLDALDEKLKNINPLDLLPTGTILAWANKTAIPSRWQLCDGTNGTPDLIDRYPIGTTKNNVGQKIGTELHSHSVKGQTDKGSREPWIPGRGFSINKGTHNTQSHKFDVKSGDSPHNPLSTRIQFIMKLN